MRAMEIALERVNDQAVKDSDLKKHRERIYKAKTPEAVTRAVQEWAKARDTLTHPVLRLLEDERALMERRFNPIAELEQNAVASVVKEVSYRGNASERVNIARRALDFVDTDTPAGQQALRLIDRDLDNVKPPYRRRSAARFLARHTKPGSEMHAHARQTAAALADAPGPVRTMLSQARAALRSLHK